MKTIKIKGHYAKRGRKKYYVKPHKRKVITSKEQGRSGEAFKKLERKVYNEYKKKGYSTKKAREIAEATAGKIFWKKYGKKSGSWILKRER